MKYRVWLTSLILVSLTLTIPLVSVAKKKELIVYLGVNHNYSTYQEAAREFERLYGYKVEIKPMTLPDMRPKLLADFTGGTPPDMFEGRPEWGMIFGGVGYLTDLTDKLAQWPDFQDWFKPHREESVVGGKTYGVKEHATTTALFYNRTLFREAGLDPDNPPRTWKEWLEAAEALTKDVNGDGIPDQYGFGIPPLGESGSDVGLLAASGTAYFNKDGTLVDLVSPEAIEMGEFLQRMKEFTYVAEPAGHPHTTRKMFATERNLGTIITGTWEVKNYREFPDLDYTVSYIPVPEGKSWNSSLHGTNLMIPKGTGAVDDTFELLKMITATEVQVQTTLKYGMTFPRKSWAEDPAIKELPLIGKFGPIMQYATSRFHVQVAKLDAPQALGRITKTMWEDLEEKLIWLEADPATALLEFTQEANRLIKEERGW